MSARLTFDFSVVTPLLAVSYSKYQENQPYDPKYGVSGGDADRNEGGPHDEERAIFRISRPLDLFAPGPEYDEYGYHQDEDSNCDVCDFYSLATSCIKTRVRG